MDRMGVDLDLQSRSEQLAPDVLGLRPRCFDALGS